MDVEIVVYMVVVVTTGDKVVGVAIDVDVEVTVTGELSVLDSSDVVSLVVSSVVVLSVT